MARNTSCCVALQEKLEELKLKERPRSQQVRLDWLRNQIEMRTVGLGWVEFASKWSSGTDETIGSVEDLNGQLKEILEASIVMISD